MCGRYASSRSPDDLVAEFDIGQIVLTERLEPDYNVAPTKNVYAVLERPPRGEERAERQLRVLSWGLVPSWAPDPGGAAKLINARMETVAAKPAFRAAFAARRCLLPADGYFEWFGRDEQGRRQPYFIRPRDRGVLAMAGLYELWRDRARDADDPRRWRWTAAVITTSSVDAEGGTVGGLHDRMPLLVTRDRYADWLDPTPRDPADLRELLVPAAPGRLEAYPVRTLVNSVANNGPELMDPLPLAPADPEAVGGPETPAVDLGAEAVADARLF
jgi:putative SOS response-associated peptidase YedK